MKTVAVRVGRKLLRESLALRAIALLPTMQFFSSGPGVPPGGSFPRAGTVSRTRPDTEGRPFDLKGSTRTLTSFDPGYT